MELITKYFPSLTDRQRQCFEQLGPLYREWNDKINVVSRKDIEQLYEHHVLHSLSIAKVLSFKPGAHVLDLGTGGGFPGIPLAILFPETQFLLIDGTRKKISVVQEVAQSLELHNVTAQHLRAEELKGKFDFVLSRGVAPLDQLAQWSFRLIAEKQRHALPNGILALKGGNLRTEIKALPKGTYSELFAISDYFDEPFFHEKYIVYVQA